MSNEQLTLITKYPDEATNVLSQLFQEPGTNTDRRWYPTPEKCDDPSKLNRIERRIDGYTTKSPNFVRTKNRPESRRPTMQDLLCQLPMGELNFD